MSLDAPSRSARLSGRGAPPAPVPAQVAGGDADRPGGAQALWLPHVLGTDPLLPPLLTRLASMLGERLPDGQGRLLQRVRLQFLGLTCAVSVVAVLDLRRIDTLVSLHAYVASVAGLFAWAVVMYRRGERWPWLDVIGPALVAALGIAAGDYSWAFAAMYGALFLHGTYGTAVRTSSIAVLYLAAYEVAAVVTLGPEAVAAGVLSHAIGLFVVAYLVRTIASSVRGHDENREREQALIRTGARLLTADDPAGVTRISLEGVEAIIGRDSHHHRISLWRQRGGLLEMSGLSGAALDATEVPLAALPYDLVELYRSGEVVRLDPPRMEALQRSMRIEAEFPQGLSVPLVEGDELIGLLFIATDRPLRAATVVALERFMHEVSLADALVRRQAVLRGVVDNSADGIVVVGRDGVVAFASPSVTQLAGQQASSFVGRPLGELLCRRIDGVVVGVETLDEATATNVELFAGDDDAVRQVELSVSEIDSDAVVLNLRDITERRRLEDEITYRAFHDPVTGLANRALFNDRVDHALARAERDGSHLAVALLDLDDFKGVNDVHGHAAGDQLLIEAAQRLTSTLRRSDTCARFGGDEFAVLMEGAIDQTEIEVTLGRLIEELRRPFVVGDRQVSMSASVGVRIAMPRDGAEVLIGDADVAMYVAKAEGKNRLIRFEASMRLAAVERRELRSEFQEALDGDQFRVEYQPIVALDTGEVTAFEALVRWQHPVRGTLGPNRFIPLAEQTGLVVPLGLWVLRVACGQLAAWQAAGLVHDAVRMSVNLSAHQLVVPRIIEDVVAALDETGLQPHHLTLEVTETALMGECERAGEVLSAFTRLGIAVAIDDFGTGYSSFAYLQRFPVNLLKIDRSFVAGITEGPEQAALAHAIIKLAQTLNFPTVAEGVEDQGQLDLLRGWGCSHGQGWHWARPMAADGGAAWLRERREEGGRSPALLPRPADVAPG
jgi:diguanylate cyclase (GGDEF)-like protein/PAS domain S-box-containing protein